MRMRARRLAAALALVSALFVAGCSAVPQPVVTRLPSDGPPSASGTPSVSASPSASGAPTAAATATSTPSSSADDADDCAGRERTISESGRTVVLTGQCPLVRIEGNAVTVDARGASVGAVAVAGDRITLAAGAIGDATVDGNDASLDVASIGALTIRGDRNTVTAPGGGGDLVVAGNDNTVTAPVSNVTVDGQRNRIG
jgi:hypothetical protein